MSSPQDIWDRFFANLMPSDRLPSRSRKRVAGKSVLDFAIGDLQRLESRLGGTEKQKLDQHLTVMRDLENQLQSLPPPVTCTAPPRHPEGGDTSSSDYYITGTASDAGIAYLNRVADFQVELLAQLLICDLTRFGTLVLPGFAGPITGGTLIPSLDGTTMVTGQFLHRHLGAPPTSTSRSRTRQTTETSTESASTCTRPSPWCSATTTARSLA